MRRLGVVVVAGLAACGRVGFDTAASGSDVQSGGSNITTGLVGWWQFAEGAGTVAHDSSGQGNTANVIGSAMWTTGPTGPALELLGNEAHLELVADHGFAQTSSFSVAMWMDPTISYAAAMLSVDPRSSSDWTQSWAIAMRGVGCGGCPSQLTFLVDYASNDDAACLCGTTVVPTGEWHHIGAVYDASVPSMDLYFDGVRDTGSYIYGSAPSAMFYAPAYYGNIGETADSYQFTGGLADVRVYDVALTAAQMAALAQP